VHQEWDRRSHHLTSWHCREKKKSGVSRHANSMVLVQIWG